MIERVKKLMRLKTTLNKSMHAQNWQKTDQLHKITAVNISLTN